MRQYVSSSTTTRTGSLGFASAFLRLIWLSESSYILVDSRETFAIIILKRGFFIKFKVTSSAGNELIMQLPLIIHIASSVF